jgi:hypothetical protein
MAISPLVPDDGDQQIGGRQTDIHQTLALSSTMSSQSLATL